jgi:hypothetical protein
MINFLITFVLVVASSSLVYGNGIKERLSVRVTVDAKKMNEDIRAQGSFWAVIKITNISRHPQVIDLWTGCTASNWLSDNPAIVAGQNECDKNYCAGKLGDYGPGEYVSKKLSIRFSPLAKAGPTTFRLGYYTCYQDPKFKEWVAWSNPITINIEPWMLEMAQK